MSDDLSDLYQELVLDHGKKPRNFRVVSDANARADGYNPLCGDQIQLYVKLNGDRIEDIGFQGSGCAISRASASMMTQMLKGKSPQEAQALFEIFHKLVTEGPKGGADLEALGKLAALSGVWEFPARVKCASLAWHTLRSALDGKGETVSTE